MFCSDEVRQAMNTLSLVEAVAFSWVKLLSVVICRVLMRSVRTRQLRLVESVPMRPDEYIIRYGMAVTMSSVQISCGLLLR